MEETMKRERKKPTSSQGILFLVKFSIDIFWNCTKMEILLDKPIINEIQKQVILTYCLFLIRSIIFMQIFLF